MFNASLAIGSMYGDGSDLIFDLTYIILRYIIAYICVK